MRIITLLDTSVASDNLGDEIIMDAVHEVVAEVFPDAYCFRVGTHDYMGEVSRRLLGKSEFCVVGGTNLLDSDMFAKRALWKLTRKDVRALPPVLLLGLGWRGYMGPVSRSTRGLLDRILAPRLLHSVRDSYAAEKLAVLKPKVINTACMTMWRLTPDWCAKLPRRRAPAAVTTLTYYRANREADRKMLEVLKARYPTVAFWPQQAEDMAYFESLDMAGVQVIPPRTDAYTRFLETEDVDFIGTRLHGGIRAMQKGHRALIVAVDNRAAEIAKDTDLPVVARDDTAGIEEWIDNGPPIAIRLPEEAIRLWKGQFT
jgi:polysaccharide pyruvyl transferase WcaK-like protein